MKVPISGKVKLENKAKVEERAEQIERSVSDTLDRILSEYFSEYDKRKRSKCACI